MTLGKVFSTDNQQVGTVFLPNPLGTLQPDGTFPGDSKCKPRALKTEEGQACSSQAEILLPQAAWKWWDPPSPLPHLLGGCARMQLSSHGQTPSTAIRGPASP